MLNNVNLCGRLTATPELKKTPNGVSVTTFTLAVDRDYSNGDERQADFINVVAWRGTAEFIDKYFAKGKMMIVSGSLQTRNYTANDGSKRYITEVVAERCYFAGDKNTNQSTAPNTAPSNLDVAIDDNEEYDDSLPF